MSANTPTGTLESSHRGTPLESDPPSDSRLVQALDEYLELVRRGRAPDRASFVELHPEIAEDLGKCLGGLELVVGALRPGDAPEEGGQEEMFGESTRLGDFRVIRVLGRGGMGVVYEAEQVSLGRRVALKVLPFASSLDPKQRQRFQVEAQAAAHLQHPHIVPVFAVGESNGTPYYAMQFIEGPSLATVIRDLRLSPGPVLAQAIGDSDTRPASLLGPAGSLAGSGRRRAFFEAAARLGAQAAEALDHAHGLGIVHRDIKPANLMLDARGDIWVTDFGLASVPGDLELTRSGDLLGTLRYMSPEQSQARRGVVDQRTDVYSLGVTLYELITHRPAFDGRDRAEVLRQIAFDDPPAPRRINPSVPRDLETIVLKAMSKDASGRYPTAREMAEDLQRFREHQPVLARRPGTLERAAKWTRRHRAVVLTAALVAMFTTAVSAAAMGMVYERYRERDHAARAEREHARQISELFGVADELAYWAMGQLAMTDTNPRGGDFYPVALQRYQKLAAVCESRSEQRDVLAGAYRRIGFIQMILRYVKHAPEAQAYDAIGSYRRSVRLYEQVLADEETSTNRAALLSTLRELAMLLSAQGPAEDFELTCRKIVAVGSPARARAEERPDEALMHVGDLSRLGAVLGRRDKWDEGLVFLRQAGDVWQRITCIPGLSPDQKARAGLVGRQLVDAFTKAGLKDEGERLLKVTQDLQPAETWNEAAWLLVRSPGGRPDEITRALELVDQALREMPNRPEFLNTKGVALLRARRYSEAIEALEESNRQCGEGPANWLPIAMARWQMGDKVEARRLLAQTIATLGPAETTRDTDLVAFRREAEALISFDAPLGQTKAP